ncbi:relaxase/mobilization nuclease domain-containing protein [Sphingobacterium puteale]|uniref:relaxase/mobilization nuclease domain-containing protein n=1 Tax=Sphingobacterium puteale TaxID=2420510 RepID=UPI003D989197
MVARIVSGKNIRGILSYNEQKVRQAEAKLLMASGFGREIPELSFHNKLERFEKLTALNERTKTNALHITLNFSRQDKLDDELLCRLASDYMEAIGFGGQPFLVYRHFDAAHPHIHLATVNIDAEGNRIETHNIGKLRSEPARKSLEISYNLIKAEDQQKEQAFVLKPADVQRAVYGKRETKAAISAIVREVVGTYKFNSLPELNAILGQFGVLADPGQEGSFMHSKGGLVYSLINELGERVGTPIKASSIYSSPTIKNLEKIYLLGKEQKKPYVLRLKHLLDRELRTATGREDFEQRLHRHGIRILLRESNAAGVYGVTFIDNATRIVVNGSAIGKDYGAKAFMEKLSGLGEITNDMIGGAGAKEPLNKSSFSQNTTVITASATGGEASPPHPGRELPVIQQLLDIAFYDEHEQITFDPYKRKKKKKGRQQSQ